jgi:drug/metabolite transporter (DMT)-like permease
MTGRLLSTSHGTNRAAFSLPDWGLLAVAAAIWGSSFLFMAIGLDSFRPGLVTWLRVVFGAATLNAYPSAHRPLAGIDRRRLSLVAILWMAAPLTLFPIAQQWISSGVTGMLNGFTPVLTAVVASFLLGSLPGRLQVAGLLVGLMGVAAIGLPAVGEGEAAALGVGLVLAALLCYGFAINLVAPLQQQYGAVPVLARVSVIAAVLTAPYGLSSLPGSHFSWAALAATLAVGCLGTGIAFVAAATLIGRVGSTRASTLTYLLPVIAILLGITFRHETVMAIQVVGCALVLLGAFLTSRREI